MPKRVCADRRAGRTGRSHIGWLFAFDRHFYLVHRNETHQEEQVARTWKLFLGRKLGTYSAPTRSR